MRPVLAGKPKKSAGWCAAKTIFLKEKNTMTPESNTPAHINEPRVLIPLAPDDMLNIDVWMKRWSSSMTRDEALAIECEKGIKTAFETLGLQYNTEAFGEVKMENLQFQFKCEREGISFSEACFAFIPADAKKI